MRFQARFTAVLIGGGLAVSACADHGRGPLLSAPGDGSGPPLAAYYECTVQVETATTSCEPRSPQGGPQLDVIVGKPSIGFVTTNVSSSRLESINEDTTRMDVALVNNMAQPIGTTDGTNADPDGSRVFFASGPRVTSVNSGTIAGSSIRVDNPAGIATFTSPDGTYTATNKPFYQYDGVIAPAATHATPQHWRFVYSANVKTFTYGVYVSTPVQSEYGWVTVTPGSRTLAAERKASFSATPKNAAGQPTGESVTWSSSNTAVATVNPASGVVTGVGEGTATITATAITTPQRSGGTVVTVVGADMYVEAFDCEAFVSSNALVCVAEGENVVIDATNVFAVGGTFQFDATLQNLIAEGLGTPDGITVDSVGINAYLAAAPVTTGGTGSVTASNADGTREFTAAGQTYWRYHEMLATGGISSSRTFQFDYEAGVTEFSFRVYVAAELQPLLVINEVMVNPAGSITIENASEWFEVYNAGHFAVQMQGMLIADSAASGRRPYHEIATSVRVAGGGYAVLAGSTDTSVNGGVVARYGYNVPSVRMNFTNSVDALKISRTYLAGDTLTIDRTQYASASTSAKDGSSRELRNPGSDNSNMDGSAWDDPVSTDVYGSGGRGTPGRQNGRYVP